MLPNHQASTWKVIVLFSVTSLFSIDSMANVFIFCDLLIVPFNVHPVAFV